MDLKFDYMGTLMHALEEKFFLVECYRLVPLPSFHQTSDTENKWINTLQVASASSLGAFSQECRQDKNVQQ